MESFDNFEIIGKKNFEIGKKSENATLPNGKKKISWDRVVGDKEEGGGGLVKDQEDQEQVDLIIDHQHIHDSPSLPLSSNMIDSNIRGARVRLASRRQHNKSPRFSSS